MVVRVRAFAGSLAAEKYGESLVRCGSRICSSVCTVRKALKRLKIQPRALLSFHDTS